MAQILIFPKQSISISDLARSWWARGFVISNTKRGNLCLVKQPLSTNSAQELATLWIIATYKEDELPKGAFESLRRCGYSIEGIEQICRRAGVRFVNYQASSNPGAS